MTGMFAQPSLPPLPAPTEPESSKYKRQPVETDPDVLTAVQRTREAALRRTGRLSTILTDQSRETVGSSGQKLGA